MMPSPRSHCREQLRVHGEKEGGKNPAMTALNKGQDVVFPSGGTVIANASMKIPQ